MKKTNTSGKTLKMMRVMSPEEIEKAAISDPDAQPLIESDFKRMKKTPRAKIIRRAWN